MITLQLTSVSKRFGDVLAVDDVSLELGDQELLALVGPSGCGKSTLLRAIAGLHPIDEGRIELGGRVVDDGRSLVPPERRRVGLVFQEHALFPHLSVAGNVAFGVHRAANERERAHEMLELVGLATYSDRYPHELSGGERQRVALARALAPSPELILLDEPFASLDPNLRTQVRDDVVSVLRSTGTPAVVVTHDQSEALAIGDRIAVLRRGRIVQIGTPEQVFHQPVDRFVASFMGEASYVEFERSNEIRGLRLPGGAGPDSLLMMRPDDIDFEVGSGDGGSCGAIVERAEFRGTMWCYTLRLDSGSAVKALRNHLDEVAVGTRVTPMLRPGHDPVVVSG